MRRAARIDNNQVALVNLFRQMGCDVVHTYQLGKGAPDAFVGFSGVWVPVEFKSEKGKLSNAQIELYKKLSNKPVVIRNENDVINVVNELKGKYGRMA